VVSRTLTSVGPKATLVQGDLASAVSRIRAEQQGEIEVAGPTIAHALTALGLIDEYRLYVHPVVLGRGTPLFAGPRSPLRLVRHETIDGQVLKLTYVPA
jgi:dihydrofolate reductase